MALHFSFFSLSYSLGYLLVSNNVTHYRNLVVHIMLYLRFRKPPYFIQVIHNTVIKCECNYILFSVTKVIINKQHIYVTVFRHIQQLYLIYRSYNKMYLQYRKILNNCSIV